MLALRIVLFVVSGLGLIIVISSVAFAFLSTSILLKLYSAADDWNLWPLNKVMAWIIEARQYRDRDG